MQKIIDRINLAILIAKTRLQSTKDDETGATAVEYGMMVALIAAVCAVGVGAVGNKVQGAFNSLLAAF